MPAPKRISSKSGVDPRATPACVNACIADALHFGDLDDPDSNVSKLLAQNQHFRMHEELGTGPGFHYIWDRETVSASLSAPLAAKGKTTELVGADA